LLIEFSWGILGKPLKSEFNNQEQPILKIIETIFRDSRLFFTLCLYLRFTTLKHPRSFMLKQQCWCHCAGHLWSEAGHVI